MSVIGFSTDEAKDLAAEIRFRARVRRTDFALAFYSWEKRSEFRALDLSCEEELENQIDCLVHRLYLANQLAFAVNYDHDKTEIVIQNPQNLKGGKVKDDMKYLYQQLSSWEYNLYTNAGRCFISDDDLETVERIKKHLLEKYSDIWGESSRPIYEGD